MEGATASGSDLFDQIVVATPVHVARKLVTPWNHQLQSLLEIEATSAVIAAFAFNREQSSKVAIPEGFGFLVPQRYDSVPSDPQLLACTFVDQKSPHRAPERGPFSALSMGETPRRRCFTNATRSSSTSLAVIFQRSSARFPKRRSSSSPLATIIAAVHRRTSKPGRADRGDRRRNPRTAPDRQRPSRSRPARHGPPGTLNGRISARATLSRHRAYPHFSEKVCNSHVSPGVYRDEDQREGATLQSSKNAC